MPLSPLARLLRPRSIAVIGGGAWCSAVIRGCRRDGFDGTLHVVHPHRDVLEGIPAHADVAALPDAPDAAFVGVNRDASVAVVRALAGRGGGGAVCFANGFAEGGDTERQRALLEAAGDMPLLGPNCYGYINALDGIALWPDQHGCRRVERGVGLITQSSNIALNLTMQRRGLPLAYVVTSGNQAQQGFAAIGRALLEDPRVTALGLHVEGFGDVRAFERLAAVAAASGKPLVVLKSGRSAAARRATLSHTASLAGSDAGAHALLRRLGVARVDTPTALLETLKLLHVHGPSLGLANGDGVAPRAVRLASMSCSGGEAALVADAVARRNDANGVTVGTERPAREGVPRGVRERVRSPRLVLPPLDAATRDALADALGPRVALANPLDYDTGIWHDAAALETVYAAMGDGDIDVVLLVLDLPRGDRCDPQDWERPVQALERAARAGTARYALVSSLPENLPEVLAERLLDAGVIPLLGIDDALAAIDAASTTDTRAASDGYAPVQLPDADAKPAGRARTATGGSSGTVPLDELRVLAEHDAKAALAAHGLDVPPGERAVDAEAAGDVARALGFPVVLKGEGLAHKSDAGAVALGLADPEAVVRAARTMPGTSFFVERMVGDGVVELLVGVVHDPAHGFVLTLGAGGLLTELLGDRVSRLLPVTGAEVSSALSELRIDAVVRGARGRSAADRDALVRAVLAVQSYVLAHAEGVLELEINPLLGTRTSAVALDALMVIRHR